MTYRDGRPVGIQPVTVRTTGEFLVGDYVELVLDEPGRAGVNASGPAPGRARGRACDWRRWRDLNPREGFALNPLSRRAP